MAELTVNLSIEDFTFDDKVDIAAEVLKEVDIQLSEIALVLGFKDAYDMIEIVKANKQNEG